MSGERAWLALLDAPDARADMAAEARDRTSGAVAGWLTAWIRSGKPVRHALRADPAAFDADGRAAVASYVLVPSERAVIFDDPAVQRARQQVLAAARPWTAVTTLVANDVHFRGSLLGVAGDDASWSDPFAAIAPARWLDLGPGLLASGPLRLPAPVIERYAGKPWPQTGFGG